MDEEQQPPVPPNGLQITSETTRLDVKPRPPAPGGGGGPRVVLALSLAMTESHTWLGIGGQSGRVYRPKRMSRNIELVLDDNPSSTSGGGGPDYLRSGDDCRRLLGRVIQNSLRLEKEYRDLTPARWDEAVPLGLERALALAVAVQRGGGCGGGDGAAFQAIVNIRVHFDFVYCEAKALRLACAENDDGGGLAGRSGNGGEAPSCSICFEEMSLEAGDEVTDLPGCTHGFHHRCIAPWFYMASTCPVCRRDQLQYLPPDYRDLHDMMVVDPDSLPDYL